MYRTALPLRDELPRDVGDHVLLTGIPRGTAILARTDSSVVAAISFISSVLENP
ncbi:hypothetical protein [Streptomyces sp. NPDC051286]|uniref:hypothetical protein n=1 Tax=Streptomyces sp. NPDC051286 TaxID=3365647 RepID=UPI0037B50B75